MATVSAIFQAHIDDLLIESIPLDLQWRIVNSTPAFLPVDLNIGDNSLPVLTTTKIIAIKPDANNGVVLKITSVPAGDYITIAPNLPTILTYSGSGSVFLNAASPVSIFLALL